MVSAMVAATIKATLTKTMGTKAITTSFAKRLVMDLAGMRLA
jgi:hypothetical protein